MADFDLSDIALLWPLLPFIGIALFAWGYRKGYGKAEGLSADIIRDNRAAYESEINALIDRLPDGHNWTRPGVYINRAETEH